LSPTGAVCCSSATSWRRSSRSATRSPCYATARPCWRPRRSPTTTGTRS
jgi:hypothetical protein